MITKYHSVTYLGDAVYLGLDDYNTVWIFTHNGYAIQQEICLENGVIDNLLLLINKIKS